MEQALTIFPLGDSAITIDLGGRIDEELNGRALAIREWLGSRGIPGIQDIIVAYSSVTLFYDPVEVMAGDEASPDGAFEGMKRILEQAREEAIPLQAGESVPIPVPVCYGGRFGPDLEAVSGTKGIFPEELIHFHSSRVYRVYMVGFLPGFAYLGKVDERLDMPRKVAPVPVLAGSVGIVGPQSGIYPLNSPGGWHILGRTPLRLFDPLAALPIRLKTGDRVRFVPIDPGEFEDIAGRMAADPGEFEDLAGRMD
jgi:inhibitor of KinA